jgi:hypothetical protein
MFEMNLVHFVSNSNILYLWTIENVLQIRCRVFIETTNITTSQLTEFKQNTF